MASIKRYVFTVVLNAAQLARIDLNLLLVFALLFEERNARRTAARLNLSPSAISHALRRLRAVLDDPLFLPTPKGMVPTELAQTLAPLIADIVERVHGVLASTQRFDPATSNRRFRIGAPDAAASVIVSPLMARMEKSAPGIDLSVVQLLPGPGSIDPAKAWHEGFTALEGGRLSLAVLPPLASEARFHSSALYVEDFVLVTRRDHPLAKSLSLEAFAAARHVLVSASGDSWGFVDDRLSERDLQRRIVLTVPSFMMAASAIASSDLVGALPRHFARQAARDHALEIVEPPFDLFSSNLHAIVPRAALSDHGIAWLLDQVEEVTRKL